MIPAPELLPAAERRRAGRTIRLALATGSAALRGETATRFPPEQLTSVFSTSTGDGDNLHEFLCTLSAVEPSISPTRFHNSVHNAASGYWSISCRCQAPTTAICAGDGRFAASLLEAAVQLHAGASAVLLVAYDVDYPAPLHATYPVQDAFGVAMLLTKPTTAMQPAPLATLTLRTTNPAHQPVDTLPIPALESLRGSNPAARGLTLLRALAQAAPSAAATVCLPFLPGLALLVDVEP